MLDVYTGLGALAFVVGVFALSEMISIKTKGTLSIMLVSSIFFIVAFANGLSPSIFISSNLYQLGSLFVAVLIVHLGTTLNMSVLIQQWKVVLVAVSAEIGIILFVLGFGSFFYDSAVVFSAIPPIGGGIVATLMVHEAAQIQGLEDIIIFTTLLLSASSFVGYPIASFLLKKEAKNRMKYFKIVQNVVEPESKNSFFELKLVKNYFEKYTSPTIILGKIIGVAFLSFWVVKLTENIINEYVVCLFFGFLFKELGFLEFDSLNRANSYGFTVVSVLSVIFHSFNSISVDDILIALVPLTFFLFLGILGMLVMSFWVGKKLKFSSYLSISIGISCMFGFPGTYIIPHEVARSIGKTAEEQQFILDGIYPQMLIAGFVNVTIASVLIASVLIRFI